MAAISGKHSISRNRPCRVPASGRQGWSEGYYSPPFNGPEIVGCLAIIRDISDCCVRESEQFDLSNRRKEYRARVESLTGSQRAVFDFLRNDKSCHEIAAEMGISVRSVTRIRGDIDRKPGLVDRNRFDLFIELAGLEGI